MKAQLMRSFAGGILIATSICGGVYMLDDSEVQTAEKPSKDEMVSLLTSEGYVVQTVEEWNKLVSINEASQKNTQDSPAEAETENEKIVYRTIVSVSSGMTSIDVENMLKSANVIDNSFDFTQEVENRGLSSELRPGTYEVDSRMTMEEVINAIF